MARCKFNLNTIELNKTVIDRLTVHSYEMSIYLVELEIGSDIGFVYDDDKPKRFVSSQEVRQAFENCKVLTAQMLHESPYDEMIGNPESAQKACFLPFHMGSPALRESL
ncbi:DUF6482 family protein [Paraglaciecola sp. 2405UD69-4]|uniref:DUF6482 family protein n=1 Tax=Paraglaciecola sp. 2405UD69-4 TaxID=3391836 RepID=UPI0039C9DD2D